MRLLTFYGLITFAVGQAASYDSDIHPEYQEGLSINDVPAERRLHWMRVANEVSQDFTLATKLIFPGSIRQWSSVPTSSFRLGHRQHYLG
jgi:hypothetical protein